MVGFALFIILLCCFIMIITALVNTEIVPSVLFGIFAGALSVVLSMIIFLCPISKESVHVVISSKVGVLEIDNTQYHIKALSQTLLNASATWTHSPSTTTSSV